MWNPEKTLIQAAILLASKTAKPTRKLNYIQRENLQAVQFPIYPILMGVETNEIKNCKTIR